MIRNDPHYRRQAFENGLRAAGYTLVDKAVPDSKRDFLIIWNRYQPFESMADAWEKSGGTVLVCENGYIGKDNQGRQLYAISAHGHNGSGWFPVGDEDRFTPLGIEVKPWQSGEHIVIRGQRGIGTKQMASPPNWHHLAAKSLQKITKRPIKVVEHPGNVKPKPTGEAELTGAHACVIWSSAIGVQALVMGVPVFYSAPHWICEWAGLPGFALIEEPLKSDTQRATALRKMAHGQWTVAEIETGEPFKRLSEFAERTQW